MFTPRSEAGACLVCFYYYYLSRGYDVITPHFFDFEAIYIKL